jgi:hypothetical protein
MARCCDVARKGWSVWREHLAGELRAQQRAGAQQELRARVADDHQCIAMIFSAGGSSGAGGSSMRGSGSSGSFGGGGSRRDGSCDGGSRRGGSDGGGSFSGGSSSGSRIGAGAGVLREGGGVGGMLDSLQLAFQASAQKLLASCIPVVNDACPCVADVRS